MRKFLILIASALLVGGCAIPVPLKIASWALDGFSMLVTKKSVTDHGLSILAQKDCAVWRGVTVGELCRRSVSGNALATGVVAKSLRKTDLTNKVSFTPSFITSFSSTSKDKKESTFSSMLPHTQGQILQNHLLRSALSEKKTLIFESHNSTTLPLKGPAFDILPNKMESIVNQKMNALTKINLIEGEKIIPHQIEVSVASALLTKQITSSKEPTEGIYFVVGSFRNANNAQKLLDNIAKLAPSILSANQDDSDVYRVVVGPVISGRESSLQRTLMRNGLQDTWAIRIDPSKWHFAKLKKTPSKTSLELAILQK